MFSFQSPNSQLPASYFLLPTPISQLPISQLPASNLSIFQLLTSSFQSPNFQHPIFKCFIVLPKITRRGVFIIIAPNGLTFGFSQNRKRFKNQLVFSVFKGYIYRYKKYKILPTKKSKNKSAFICKIRVQKKSHSSVTKNQKTNPRSSVKSASSATKKKATHL